MMKSLPIEILDYMKHQYQDQVLNLIRNELIDDFSSLKFKGVNSLYITFENDGKENAYFDSNKGITFSKNEEINIDKLKENILPREDYHINSHMVKMINFIVENIKLDVDDYIAISSKSVVIEIRSVKELQDTYTKKKNKP